MVLSKKLLFVPLMTFGAIGGTGTVVYYRLRQEEDQKNIKNNEDSRTSREENNNNNSHSDTLKKKELPILPAPPILSPIKTESVVSEEIRSENTEDSLKGKVQVHQEVSPESPGSEDLGKEIVQEDPSSEDSFLIPPVQEDSDTRSFSSSTPSPEGIGIIPAVDGKVEVASDQRMEDTGSNLTSEVVLKPEGEQLSEGSENEDELQEEECLMYLI